jgi:hypothetical protein
MKPTRNIKRGLLLGLAAIVAVAGLLASSPAAIAQMGGGISSPSLWKLAGSTVSLVNNAWSVALGTISVSGVVSGDMNVSGQVTVSGTTTSAGDIYSAGLKWTARTSSTDNEWRSITYGNGLFVASSKTGSGDQIMTSPDGINWTTRSTPAAREWRYVTYGNGMFVAVAATGTGNRIMTSYDGVTWTARTSPADYFWRAVAWGGGQFVATANNGTGNQVMTSPDGINWTLRSTPATGQWANVRYGNGIWVTTSADGLSTTNQVMTSTDGINWTAHDSSVVCDFFGLEYGKGLFIASGTDCLMTSPDGINWTTRTVPSGSSHQWHAIKYGDGLFVSVSKTGNERAMYSYDGITWTAVETPNLNAYHDVTFGNGMFVAAANSGTGNRIMTSGNMRSYDVTYDDVTRHAVTIAATGTAALAVQGGDRNNFLTADTTNRLLRIIGPQTPTSNLFEVSNKDNSKKYLTVSSTSTTFANGSAVTVNIGQTTDNGSGLMLNGANSYISSTSNNALVLIAPGSANLMYFQVNSVNRFTINASGDAAFGHAVANARLNISERSATKNLFEINDANTSGVYTTKYLTVSSTSTKISNAFHVEVLETTNTSLTVAATNTVIIMRGVVARTVTLPACAAGDVGRKLYIDDGAQNANTNNITVNRAGSDTVDGGTSKTINTAGGSLQLICAAATRWFSL